MRTGVVDFHCDVVGKLLTGEASAFTGADAASLDVTYERLEEADAVLQNFAIYISERMDKRFAAVLAGVDLFHRHVLSQPGVAFVRSAPELRAALEQERFAAMLSLEGADALQGDFTALRILSYLGVRSLGLTWNHANWAADGVMEPRRGGLTRQGRELVKACNDMDIIIDVSHLSERGFWETAELTKKPLITSHSNAQSVCGHPRNLTDEQIRAIIAQGGLIGVTFVPWFVKTGEPVRADDLLPHIDKICELGGLNHLMLGSDFDGIDRHIDGLSDPRGARLFVERLADRYGEREAALMARGNALRFLLEQLPQQ